MLASFHSHGSGEEACCKTESICILRFMIHSARVRHPIIFIILHSSTRQTGEGSTSSFSAQPRSLLINPVKTVCPFLTTFSIPPHIVLTLVPFFSSIFRSFFGHFSDCFAPAYSGGLPFFLVGSFEKSCPPVVHGSLLWCWFVPFADANCCVSMKREGETKRKKTNDQIYLSFRPPRANVTPSLH